MMTTGAASVRIEALGLAHRYGSRLGLAPIDFEREGPGVVAFTGANGSGKSTLLRILAGLLRPTHGSTRLLVGAQEAAPAARRQVIGFASPAISFYDEMSIAENLGFSAEARGMSDGSGAVARAIERVGLRDRANERMTALSSGMLQRVRLAFALMHDPPVLLLDEPGSHLDAAGRGLVEAVIGEWGRKVLVLLATNDEREWKLADERIELAGSGLGSPS